MSSIERCDALINTISEFNKAVVNTSQTPISRQGTTANMLDLLHVFARDLYSLFDLGFRNNTLKSTDLTSDYVFGLLNDQISYDLDAILRAYTQRYLVENRSTPNSIFSKKVEHLKIADELACEILRAAMDAALVPRKSTVLTYFQKDLRIRLMPYAPVAFVGLPFSAIHEHGDYVALAHEIGHYVYHRAVQSQAAANPIFDFISSYNGRPLPWYYHWLEELIADVFGCIIAGPAIAASFQDLSLQYTKDESVLDDQRHPAPVLRPYIYIDALKTLAKVPGKNLAVLEQVADELETNWSVKAQSLPQKITVRSRPTPSSSCITELSVDDARAQLAPVISDLVNKTFTVLVDMVTKSKYGFHDVWNAPANWEMPPSTKLGPQVGSTNDKACLGDDESLTRPDSWFFTKMEQIDNAVKDKQEVQEVQEIDWLALLTFGGWIEQGPGGGIAHG